MRRAARSPSCYTTGSIFNTRTSRESPSSLWRSCNNGALSPRDILMICEMSRSSNRKRRDESHRVQKSRNIHQRTSTRHQRNIGHSKRVWSAFGDADNRNVIDRRRGGHRPTFAIPFDGQSDAFTLNVTSPLQVRAILKPRHPKSVSLSVAELSFYFLPESWCLNSSCLIDVRYCGVISRPVHQKYLW